MSPYRDELEAAIQRNAELETENSSLLKRVEDLENRVPAHIPYMSHDDFRDIVRAEIGNNERNIIKKLTVVIINIAVFFIIYMSVLHLFSS